MTELDLIEKYLPKYKQKKAKKLLNKGYPVQYIIGNVEFLDYLIYVNKDVLIPRFETELLVDLTYQRIKKYNMIKPYILDLCTGSGCIAISLKDKTNGDVDALDISKKALKIAKKNAKINNTAINFINCDLEKYKTTKLYDVIISNPPYVSYDETVDPKTKYEPSIALFAEDSGLYFYKKIFELYKNNLKDKYLLAFEIGMNQGEQLVILAKKYFPNAKIDLEKDLTGRNRFLFITNYE